MDNLPIEQFILVTGATQKTAKQLLEACGGNLDLAINVYLEGNGSSGHTETGSSRITAPQDHKCPNVNSQGCDKPGDKNRQTYEEIHGVRAPIPQSRGILIEEEPPPRRILRSRKLPQTVFDPFQDFSAGCTKSDNNRKNLAELFKPPHDIMFSGTFQEARAAGDRRKRWLLVNVQDSKEFSCQVLNRDVWSNHNVKDIIQQHFVFMQLHRITDSGVKFKQMYHVDTYPCIAVIDPRTGEKLATWNNLTATQFISLITEFLASNPFDADDSISMENQKDSVAELSEDLQLEAAIKASLKDVTACNSNLVGSQQSTSQTACQLVFSDNSDEECVFLSSDEASDMDTDGGLCHKGSSSNLKVTKLAVQHDSLANSPPLHGSIKLQNLTVDVKPLIKRKRPLSVSSENLQLPKKVLRMDSMIDINATVSDVQTVKHMRTESPNNEGIKPGATGKETNITNSSSNIASRKLKESIAEILFRLPDGSRVQKSFLGTHPIEELFDFLKLQGIDMSEHEVVTHFPKRNISELERSMNFRDAGLYPREVVFVHSSD